MLTELRKEVCNANLELVRKGVVVYTWGNVSGIDRDKGLVVIKPSGVDYTNMSPEDMVVVDLNSGSLVEGKYKPSSDTPTHLELYREFPEIGGIAHTHSINAVAFAQAGIAIPALGTTHADYFYGDIPCTRELTQAEVDELYETNTGRIIVECVNNLKTNPLDIPGVLVRNHGPFTFGRNADEAVFNSVVLEQIAEMAQKTLLLNKNSSMKHYILEKHYYRKHGPKAYYGQNNKMEK